MKYDELAEHLASLQRESRYRVDAVLKASPVEITQRVFFRDGGGAEIGPFVRKLIKRDVGMGEAYERLFRAQRDGCRFRYLPNIRECYLRDDCLVVIMEYVKGQTLQETVYQHDPSLELAVSVFPSLCDAVTELHGASDSPIVHCDLKPSNIILTSKGPMLIDFGISREYRARSEKVPNRFGTKGFAAPEQFGFGLATVRSDVYSLGLVLYFCLTETIPDAAAHKCGFAGRGIPESVRAVIERAASADSSVRYASASDLRKAFLEACLA